MDEERQRVRERARGHSRDMTDERTMRRIGKTISITRAVEFIDIGCQHFMSLHIRDFERIECIRSRRDSCVIFYGSRVVSSFDVNKLRAPSDACYNGTPALARLFFANFDLHCLSRWKSDCDICRTTSLLLFRRKTSETL